MARKLFRRAAFVDFLRDYAMIRANANDILAKIRHFFSGCRAARRKGRADGIFGHQAEAMLRVADKQSFFTMYLSLCIILRALRAHSLLQNLFIAPTKLPSWLIWTIHHVYGVSFTLSTMRWHRGDFSEKSATLFYIRIILSLWSSGNWWLSSIWFLRQDAWHLTAIAALLRAN